MTPQEQMIDGFIVAERKNYFGQNKMLSDNLAFQEGAQLLKPMLLKALEVVEFYADKNNYTQLSDTFSSHVKLNENDYETWWNNNIGFTAKTGGKKARTTIQELQEMMKRK